MRFIGCKLNLIPYIERLVTETLGIREGVFCDIFAGTATVGAHFKKRGFQIISNDLLELSSAFQHALIANNTEPEFAGIIETLAMLGMLICLPHCRHITRFRLVKLLTREKRFYLQRVLSIREQ